MSNQEQSEKKAFDFEAFRKEAMGRLKAGNRVRSLLRLLEKTDYRRLKREFSILLQGTATGASGDVWYIRGNVLDRFERHQK